ncbi:MAG: hypothetical protein Q4A31_02280 [Corynebacterium sp.]|uniref:hypothetical protein n=1 Tax=Corynebacterium sp. TaxID=1720 RepID=UPI0026DBD36D|nr:hypothetical protein [Corynebacterium sp.]MDO4760732.1 hypothetical protein [Corynebacterium sp.]
MRDPSRHLEQLINRAQLLEHRAGDPGENISITDVVDAWLSVANHATVMLDDAGFNTTEPPPVEDIHEPLHARTHAYINIIDTLWNSDEKYLTLPKTIHTNILTSCTEVFSALHNTTNAAHRSLVMESELLAWKITDTAQGYHNLQSRTHTLNTLWEGEPGSFFAHTEFFDLLHKTARITIPNQGKNQAAEEFIRFGTKHQHSHDINIATVVLAAWETATNLLFATPSATNTNKALLLANYAKTYFDNLPEHLHEDEKLRTQLLNIITNKITHFRSQLQPPQVPINFDTIVTELNNPNLPLEIHAYTDAITEYNTVAANTLTHTDTRLNLNAELAIIYHSRGHFQQARLFYAQALELIRNHATEQHYPLWAQVLYNAALLEALALANPLKALYFADEALVHFSSDQPQPDLDSTLGRFHSLKHNILRALHRAGDNATLSRYGVSETTIRAIELTETILAHIADAETLRTTDSAEQAYQHVEKTTAQYHNHPEPMVRAAAMHAGVAAGSLLLFSNNFTTAISYHNRLLETYSNDIDHYIVRDRHRCVLNIAIAYGALHNYQACINYCDRVIEHSNEHEDEEMRYHCAVAHTTKAYALKAIGNLDAAINTLVECYLELTCMNEKIQAQAAEAGFELYDIATSKNDHDEAAKIAGTIIMFFQENLSPTTEKILTQARLMRTLALAKTSHAQDHATREELEWFFHQPAHIRQACDPRYVNAAETLRHQLTLKDHAPAHTTTGTTEPTDANEHEGCVHVDSAFCPHAENAQDKGRGLRLGGLLVRVGQWGMRTLGAFLVQRIAKAQQLAQGYGVRNEKGLGFKRSGRN